MARKKSNILAVDGGLLTSARIAKGMRGQDVADHLAKLGIGCHKSAVCRWEQGKTKPTDDQIRAMAKLLGTKNFVIGG